MSFLYPGFLFALSALIIPIIVHLFNFRRYKKLYFSNVSFLQNVKEETRSRSKIKHLLTLLMRLLALAFLILAFAQPYIPSDEGNTSKGDRAVSIYIDNSFSMEGEEAEGRLIDLAKDQAIRIVESYEATDRFQLHTNSPSSAQHRWYTKSELIDRIEEIEVGPYTEKASSIIAAQKEGLRNRKENGRIFFISDLQRSVTDPGNFEKNGSPTVHFLPLQPEHKRNLYVDSVWFQTPVRMLDQEEELGVRLVNTGNEKAEDMPVELWVNGERTALGSFDIPANGFKDTSLFFTHSDTGIHHASLRINDHPISFDDRFFFAYRVAGSIPVLRIHPSKMDITENDGTAPIASVFKGDPLFRYRSASIDRIDHSMLDEENLIILDRPSSMPSGLTRELKKFLQEGGHVALIPAMGAGPDAYNSFLKKLGIEAIDKVDSMAVQIQKLNRDHPFYNNVFQEVPKNMQLPEVNFHFRMKKSVRSKSEPLMTLRNGEAFLFTAPVEDGRAYVFAAPPEPEASDLIGHALFPTTLLRMAELSQASEAPYRTIGSEKGIKLRGSKPEGETPLRLEAKKGELSLIPEQEQYNGITRIHLRGRIKQAGNYEIVHEEQEIRGIGINYSRKESELAHYSSEAFQSEIDAQGKGYQLVEQAGRRTQASIGEISEGTSLWWYCLIFALIFFGLETLILAFPKTLRLER